jgi:hypothetical protein
MMLDGISSRGASRFDAQLRVDGSKVRVDRPGADPQLFGELPVRETTCHAPQDLDLAGREAICSGPFRHYCVRLDNVRSCGQPNLYCSS